MDKFWEGFFMAARKLSPESFNNVEAGEAAFVISMCLFIAVGIIALGIKFKWFD